MHGHSALKKNKSPLSRGFIFGGLWRIRTAGLCNANAALYQLS